MSKYTTEVRYICEQAAGKVESEGFNRVDEVIENAIPVIFSFEFPIFDENYREVICGKILRHYYTREIGFETVGLWKLKLQTRLNEIMPFYNQLYNSELLKFNPLYDVDVQTTHVGNKDSENVKQESKTGTSTIDNERAGSNNETANSTSADSMNNKESGNNEKSKATANNYNDTESATKYDLFSETPQGALTGVDDEEYLTNARKITDSVNKNGKNDGTEVGNEEYKKNVEGQATNASNSSVNGNFTENGTTEREDSETVNGSDRFNSTESYILHVSGKQGGVSYSKLLKEFRETFLNIDMEIINDLRDLFMNLW